jgi:hypothetical protein
LTTSQFLANIQEEIGHAASYIPADTPPQFKQLLEQCLKWNPEQRPTFDQIASQLEQIVL